MLLKTRFYLPPLRKNGVVRTGLLAFLDQTQGGDLVLVSAPPGYGKSTLISQWLHLRPQSFAWLSLGAEHNVNAVFRRQAINSLQQVQPDIGLGAEFLLQASGPLDLSFLVVTLLNDLDGLSEMDHSNSAITLVFDDFHFVSNPAIIESFNLFLDHLPSSIRVVVTSRDLPALKIAKRRASQQLRQVTADELRFSEREATDFFCKTMNLTAFDRQAAQFCGQTEGWIAGLQLIALSLRKSPHDVEALLANNVLH